MDDRHFSYNKKLKKKNPNLTMRSQAKQHFISGKMNHKRLISNMGSLEGLTFCQFLFSENQKLVSVNRV
jgi:hypothetical protein